MVVFSLVRILSMIHSFQNMVQNTFEDTYCTYICLFRDFISETGSLDSLLILDCWNSRSYPIVWMGKLFISLDMNHCIREWKTDKVTCRLIKKKHDSGACKTVGKTPRLLITTPRFVLTHGMLVTGLHNNAEKGK